MLVIPRAYIDIVDGDLAAALLLSQLIYWSNKTYAPDGWIFKTYDDIQREIGLTQHRAAHAKEVLDGLGLIKTELRKIGAAPKLHYCVDFAKLVELLLADKGGEVSQDNLIEGMPPEVYFEKLDREKVGERKLPGRRSEKECQERVKQALTRGLARQKDVGLEDYLGKIPEFVRPLMRAFCEKFGRIPLKSEDGYWRAEIAGLYEIGVNPEDVASAFDRMNKDGLTIKSPKSVRAVAEEFKRKREEKPQTKDERVVVYSEAAKKYSVGGSNEQKR